MAENLIRTRESTSVDHGTHGMVLVFFSHFRALKKSGKIEESANES